MRQRRITRVSAMRTHDRVYIACEDMDFAWYVGQVDLVVRWWKRGMSLSEMAEKLGRSRDELAILLIDLGRRGRIKQEEYGVMAHVG